ncbi:CaiB/BaiF CoA transferase family protein [Paraburkholderia caffeinilytica]|uniref:CaiB/BaiF CoA transferase family protein n=1 Tax=Paraburkholderia caffeinilytica TaxID=1761016 RepID=UPI003DA11A00
MGPLHGVRVVEIAGLGAAPYGAMMLADMGADVVRIDRPDGDQHTPDTSPLLRNRRSIALDLKQPEGVASALALIDKAEVLIEAFRPGVAERLGIGPEICLERNARLVYARMTGWGQQGPLSQRAGHDLNYIGISGLLNQIGPTGGKPAVPLNVIGDFGGGGLLLAYGVTCALLEARVSGLGQVVDAAMLDGAASFLGMFFGYRADGKFIDGVGRNFLGGGAHYYDTYQTQDGKFLSVAPIEPQFYAAFLERLGVDTERFMSAGYPSHTARNIEHDWPELKAELAAIFVTRPRDEWCRVFEGADVCVTPVLSLQEALQHPHNVARETFVEVDGVAQNAPAPRFSRTPAGLPRGPRPAGADVDAIVTDWDLDRTLFERASRANHQGTQ